MSSPESRQLTVDGGHNVRAEIEFEVGKFGPMGKVRVYRCYQHDGKQFTTNLYNERELLDLVEVAIAALQACRRERDAARATDGQVSADGEVLA